MSEVSKRSDAGAGAERRRVRVRTPGKHIVLFALAVTFMLGLSTTAIRSGRVLLPDYDLSALSADEQKTLYAPPLEFLTDLAPDSTGRAAYLKARLKVVARDRKALAELTERQPFIQERVAFLLRGLSSEDFEGDVGMARVKAEILKRVNIAAAPGAATDIIIEDLVIQ
ncbi:MAG: flagellar basal body-associated FliL family protein [Parvularculaceae bacterium]|nr:flagellar basal body-associated FliL family protein [Parvularculaceae bacterium]